MFTPKRSNFGDCFIKGAKLLFLCVIFYFVALIFVVDDAIF